MRDVTDCVFPSRKSIDWRGAKRRGENSESRNREKVEKLDWGHFDGLWIRQEDGFNV